jgi:hypothetical protein
MLIPQSRMRRIYARAARSEVIEGGAMQQTNEFAHAYFRLDTDLLLPIV